MNVKIFTSQLKDGNMRGANQPSLSSAASIFATANNLSPDTLTTMRQQHTSNIEHVHRPGSLLTSDGLFTNKSGIPLAIYTADCLPVVLYDNSGLIALHAGYKGLEKGILENALNLINPSKTVAWIGPSICEACYDVNPQRAARFRKKFNHVVTQKGTKSHLNLKKLALTKLVTNGVKKPNVTISPECTKCSGNYYSYRRGNNGLNMTLTQIS